MKISFSPDEKNNDIITLDSTEFSILKTISSPVIDNHEIIVQNLIKIFKNTKYALGLAAPQINIGQRAFITKLKEGTYVFINPVINNTTFKRYVSNEGCLSIPGLVRILNRWENILLGADKIYQVDENWNYNLIDITDLEYKESDAAILQHEIDHLNGVLIDSYAPTLEEKIILKKQRREKKIKERRILKKSKKNKIQKISSKRLEQIEKNWKQFFKREKNRVKIQSLMS